VARGALTRAAAVFLILGSAARVCAQGIEVAPFTGYRVGGDVFDVTTLRPADVDRSPSVGVVLDVPLWQGFQVEGIFSHQQVAFTVFPDAVGPAARLHGAVDHWEGGALQEYGGGAVRPFLSGVLGLTRYAIEADEQVRFTVGAGGGVKLFPTPHLGFRLEGRLFSTFLDATTTSGVCGGRGCIVGIHFDVAWQLEFAAALVVKFGPGA
jgi:hypothetical protein